MVPTPVACVHTYCTEVDMIKIYLVRDLERSVTAMRGTIQQ